MTAHQDKSTRLLFFFACLLSVNLSFSKNEINWKQLWEKAETDTSYIRKLADKGNETEIMRAGFWDSLYILSEKVKYEYGIAAANELRGYIFFVNDKPADAIIAWKEALPILEKLNLHSNASAILNNMGYLFHYQGNSSASVDCYFRAIKHLELAGDQVNLASVIANTASLYADMKEYEKSFVNYRKALSIWTILNKKAGICRTYNNMAYTFLLIKNADSSLFYLDQARVLGELIKDTSILQNIYLNTGEAFALKGDKKSAIAYYNKALESSDALQNDAGRSSALLKIAGMELDEGKTAAATAHTKKAFAYATQKGFARHIRDAAFFLVTIYRKSGNLAAALDMQDYAYKLKDSIDNEESKKELLQQQFQYDFEKKEAAMQAGREKEAQQFAEKSSKLRMIILITIGGLTMVALSALVLLQRFRITRKQKKIIENQKEEVDLAYRKLNEKNKEVMDSIQYAKRIQTSLLTNEKYIERKLKELSGNSEAP